MEIFTRLLNTYRISKFGFLKKLPILAAVIFNISLNCIFDSEAFGQVVPIWTNPIAGTNPGAAPTYTTGDVTNPYISVSGIGNFGLSAAVGNDAFFKAGFTSSSSIVSSQYISFSITPNPGYRVSLNNFYYTGVAGTKSPDLFAFRSNVNAYSNDITATLAISGGTVPLTEASFQNLSLVTGFRFYGWRAGSPSGTFGINDFTFTGSVLGSATTSLSGFSYVYGSGSSAAQSFTVNGAGLTASAATVTIIGSANYEVSTTSPTTGFSSTASLTASGGSLNGSTVWVRLKSGLAVNTYNETITFGGGGVSGIAINVSGAVTKANLTVTADSKTKIYGAAIPALTYTYSGFIGSDNSSSYTSQPTIATTATASSAAGSYPIAVSGGAFSNYNLLYAPGSLSVTPAPLTLTADAKTKIYGDVNPSLTYTHSGFVNGDVPASLTTQPAMSTTANTSSVVGNYPITPSGAASPNYTINYVGGSLTITPALLTITAENKAKVYGTSNPVLTTAYVGFKGTDNSTSLTTTPSAITSADVNSPVGTYPITVSGAASSNYTFNYAGGTITVSKASVSVVLTSDNNPVCQGGNVTLSAAVSANPAGITGSIQFFDGATLIGTSAVVNDSGSITISSLTAGSHNLTAKYTGDANYNTSTSSAVNQVVNARATAALSGNTTICKGAGATLSIAVTGPGIISGILSDGTAFSGVAPTITVAVNPTSNNTYTIVSLGNSNCISLPADVSGSAIITVNEPIAISIQPGPVTQIVCSGQTVTYSVEATGTGPLIYQWYKGNIALVDDGVKISGATTPTLSLLLVNAASSTATGNEYYVKVSGPAVCNPVNSSNLSLTVNTEIIITSQPLVKTVCEGSNATFTATAEGTGPFSVQWFKGSSQISTGVNTVYNSSTNITTTLTMTGVTVADQAANYYVIFKNESNICPTEVSNEAALNVTPVSVGGTVSSNQTICRGSTPAGLTLTGQTGNIVKWQKSTSSNFLSGVTDIFVTSTTLAASSMGILTATTYFRAVVQNGVCSEAYSSSVIVTVDPVSVGGSGSANQTICSGNTPAEVSVSGYTGAILKWQKSTVSDFTSSVTDIAGITSTLAGSSIGSLTTTTYVRAVIQSGSCSVVYSSPVTITVDPISVGGTVSANQTICSGSTPAALVLSGQTGGVVRWQKSISSDFLSGVSDISTTSTTLAASSIGILTATTYFRAVVQSGICSEAYSSSTTVTVDPVSVAGSVSANQTICRGSAPAAVILSGYTGAILKWQRSTVSSFESSVTDIAVLTPTLTGTSIGSLTTTTYVRAVVQSGVCSIAYSLPITITVDPISVGGAVSSNQTICSGTTPAAITLTGQTGTIVKWQKSTSSTFSGAVDIVSTSATLTTSLIGSLTTTTYFRAVVQSGVCSPVPSGSVTITVNPTSVGGSVLANQTICSGSIPAAITLSGFTGAVVKWQKSTDSNFASSVTDIAGTNTTLSGSTIGALTTTTYFRAVVQSGVCSTANSSPVTITVDPVSVGGTLSPAKGSGCEGTASGTITLSGVIGAVSRWEYSNNAGNAWFPINNTTTTLNYSNLSITTIYRAVIQSGSCGPVYSSVSIIVVDPKYTPKIVATPDITCIGLPVTLTALGYESLGTVTGGNFSDAMPPGWNGASANNNNEDPNSAWGLTNGDKVFNSVKYTSTGKFMIATGVPPTIANQPPGTTYLTTPFFSTVGLTTFSLTWRQAYNLNVGAVAKVEISIDGGLNYITLETYTGPKNLGPTEGLTSASINLDAYLGRTDLKFRFNYQGSSGSNWAIDDVNMSQTYYPLNYTWTGAGLSSTTGSTVIYTPTASGTFNLQVSTTTNSNCPGAGSGTIPVTVNPSPTLGTVTIAPVCFGSDLTVKLTGLLANSTSALLYQIDGGAVNSVGNVLADAAGNASFIVPVSLVNSGLQLKITSISSKRTSINAVSCSMVPGANGTSAISIVKGYVWTGEGANNLWTTAANWNICGVPPDGSSVTIPDVTSKHFPKLDVDFFTTNNFDLLGNATIDLNGKTFELGTSTSSVLNMPGQFIGSITSNLTVFGASTNLKFSQTAVGATNALKNFIMSGVGQTVTLGNPLWVVGNVFPTAGVIASSGNLTMVSTATTSSNITAFALPNDVSGVVNVQAYITGGGPGLVNRGFRSMSSPINDDLVNGNKTFKQMKTYIPITGPGGVTNGFDQGGAAQPFAETITLYNETAPAFAPSAPSIATIDQAQIPGTGFLAFFRGSQGVSYANNFTKLNAPFVTPDPVTITYSGPINKFDLPTIALNYTNNLNDSYNGYNLVGNPYPSSIDWNNVTRSANVINTFIIVLPGGKQASYLDGIINNIPTTIIQPTQGFYVRANSAGGTLSFKENSKSILYPNRLLAIPQNVIMSSAPLAFGGSDKVSSAERVIRLKIEDGINTDETTLVFKHNGAMAAGFEDALYFSGGGVSLASLSSESKRLAINGLPDLEGVKEVRLAVNSTASKPVKLNFFDLSQAHGYEVFLKDTLSPGKLVNVKKNPIYDFSIDKSKLETYGTERFTIVFKKEEIFPLKLNPFIAKKQNEVVELTWTIVATGIAKEFEIEQSADGITFHKIGSIKSQGNLKGNETYYFTDQEPLQGMNYYRVRQVHSNGRLSISEIRSIDNSSIVGSAKNKMIVYPNPALEEIEIKLTDRPDETLELIVYDMNGRTVHSSSFTYQDELRYNVREFNPAIYIIELRSVKTSKLIGREKFVKGL